MLYDEGAADSRQIIVLSLLSACEPAHGVVTSDILKRQCIRITASVYNRSVRPHHQPAKIPTPARVYQRHGRLDTDGWMRSSDKKLLRCVVVTRSSLHEHLMIYRCGGVFCQIRTQTPNPNLPLHKPFEKASARS